MSAEELPQDVPNTDEEGAVDREGGGSGGGEDSSGGVGVGREPANAVEAGVGGGVGLVREPVSTVESMGLHWESSGVGVTK